jgi:hypothetical protein
MENNDGVPKMAALERRKATLRKYCDLRRHDPINVILCAWTF